ncbi:MAG: hypothetical protein N5P05_004395 (plasmid) [Chroococcopsis gigantea SAG 12.99]|jgi:phage protein D|nr:hypothetical protein [Chroococcopsis gigantea SAG 12.99]
MPMPVPRTNSPLVAEATISINGSPLSVEARSHLIAVTVEDDLYLPGFFEIELTGSGTQANDRRWPDEADFAPGNSVEIGLGYLNDVETVFKGEITEVDALFSQNNAPRVCLRGYDRRHRLQRGRKVRSFVKQKDSDIATKIAQEAGLTPQVVDSSVSHEYVLQNNQTDLIFLQERAEQINYEVVVMDKTLSFRPAGNGAGDSITLKLDEDLIEFSPCLNAGGQITEVQVQGWDVKTKKAIRATARKGAEVAQMGGKALGSAFADSAFGGAISIISDRPVAGQEEAQQIAGAQFNRTLLHFIEGRGRCFGRTDLKAGKVVKIEVGSDRFSGSYYVTTVSHHYQVSRGYYTSFTVGRNAL